MGQLISVDKLKMAARVFGESVARGFKKGAKKRTNVSDHEGHFDIDGVSFSKDAGVIVASDKNKVS